jgi:hypothetical protein
MYGSTLKSAVYSLRHTPRIYIYIKSACNDFCFVIFLVGMCACCNERQYTLTFENFVPGSMSTFLKICSIQSLYITCACCNDRQGASLVRPHTAVSVPCPQATNMYVAWGQRQDLAASAKGQAENQLLKKRVSVLVYLLCKYAKNR